MEGKIDLLSDRPKIREDDGQTNRQTDRQTETDSYYKKKLCNIDVGRWVHDFFTERESRQREK